MTQTRYVAERSERRPPFGAAGVPVCCAADFLRDGRASAAATLLQNILQFNLVHPSDNATSQPAPIAGGSSGRPRPAPGRAAPAFRNRRPVARWAAVCDAVSVEFAENSPARAKTLHDGCAAKAAWNVFKGSPYRPV